MQPTPAEHGGWPRRPQPEQPPFWHAPRSVGPQPASIPTQVCAAPVQHPPARHPWPGQHGWPGLPHGLHTFDAQASPDAVQKLAAVWVPMQHGSPEPPHAPHEPSAQTPRPPAHIVVAVVQVPPAQHAPAPWQRPPAQHG